MTVDSYSPWLTLVPFLYAGVFISLIFGIAFIILGPFHRVVRGKQLPNRFMTGDFLWLTLLLQYPLALILAAQEFNSDSELMLVGGMLILMSVVVWLRGSATLSYLQITSLVRRGLFLAVLVPVASLGAVIGVPLLLTLFHVVGWPPAMTFPPISVGLLLLSLGLRKLSFWVLSGSHKPQDALEQSAE